MQLTKQQLGRFGEDIACEYLKNNNYCIIERNFRCNQGEIDIIAFDNINKEIVFIEVKTRSNFNYGLPCEAVNYKKKMHIVKTIKYYLNYRNIKISYIRVDVIEIMVNGKEYKINHLKQII